MELDVQEKREGKIRGLQEMAAAAFLQGEKYSGEGRLELAEKQYLLALRTREQLYAATGEEEYARAAEECCTSLADICMQQGNMHGADFYYARAMAYSRGIRFPSRQNDRLRTEEASTGGADRKKSCRSDT